MKAIRGAGILAALVATLVHAGLIADPTTIVDVTGAATLPPAGLIVVIGTVLLGVASKTGRTPRI